MDFAFKTTLAGKAYVLRIRSWQSLGYSMKLVFLQLRSVEQAMAPDVIARRFKAGLSNFEGLYRPLVNEWQKIDNGGPAPRLLSEGGRP